MTRDAWIALVVLGGLLFFGLLVFLPLCPSLIASCADPAREKSKSHTFNFLQNLRTGIGWLASAKFGPTPAPTASCIVHCGDGVLTSELDSTTIEKQLSV